MDLRAEQELSEHLQSLAGPLRWHIALTKPGQDEIAEKALKMRGYTIYRPRMPRKHIRRNREFDGACSMFPGYEFVLPPNHCRRTDIGPWEALRAAPGMIYGDGAMFRLNGRLATIAHNDPVHVGIVQIREFEQSLWAINRNGEATKPLFHVGERVEVRKGPWIKFFAEIVTLDEHARNAILRDILGRRVRASYEHLVSVEI